MISALAFVPRGVAAPNPRRQDLTADELATLGDLAKLRLGAAVADLKQHQGENGSKTGDAKDVEMQEAIDPELAEYDLENYDDDDEDAADEVQDAALFGNIKGLVYYDNPDEDPYITIKRHANDGGRAVDDDEESEGSDSETGDLQVRTTDHMLLATRTAEDDVSQLEVYIYEHAQDNLYVHHDIMLPAFPLCVARVGYSPAAQTVGGNYVAIGTFDPEIEIWDLDVVDPVYPVTVLGLPDDENAVARPTGKKKKRAWVDPARHTDAVLSLAWNATHPHLLASASADHTVRLWDLSTKGGKCAHVLTMHTDKVQSVVWHPTDAAVLATASYDKTLCVFDSRLAAADLKESARVFALPCDPEAVQWLDAVNVLVALEDGTVRCFDVVAQKSVWTLAAHDGAVSALAVSTHVPGCIATGGTDGKVKLWDVLDGRPRMVHSRDGGGSLGKVFSLTFAPDAGTAVLGMGGSGGKVQVWDLAGTRAVRDVFGKRMVPRQSEGQGDVAVAEEAEDRPVVEMPDDDSESSSGEEMDEASMEDDEDESASDV